MNHHSNILEAAHAIRSHLHELLPADAAADMGRTLDDLISQAEGGDHVDDAILKVLSAPDATREWLRRFQWDRHRLEQTKTISPLPGEISMVNAPTFVCPLCDYVWYRPRVGMNPPLCPTHNVPLQPV